MSDVKNTAEPWSEIVPDSYYGKGITRIQKLLECADTEAGPECSDIEWVETKRRIVACVNALQGVPTEFLEKAVQMGITDVSQGNLFSSRVELQKQRDQVLDALEYISRFIDPTAIDGETIVKHAREAIAAVKGEK